MYEYIIKIFLKKTQMLPALILTLVSLLNVFLAIHDGAYTKNITFNDFYDKQIPHMFSIFIISFSSLLRKRHKILFKTFFDIDVAFVIDHPRRLG